MKRREFIALLGGAVAAAGLRTARGQQPQLPLIGFLGGRTAQIDAHWLAAFHQGLNETGFADGRNVRIEYRWANGRYDRLPSLAAELAQLMPAVIVAIGGSASGLAAKSATTIIPVVFAIGGDPVELGLVPSLGRPDGNMTGVTLFSAPLDAKRLELLREIVPTAKVLAAILNPSNPNAESQLRQAQVAASAFGQTLHLFHARTDQEIDEAFRVIGELRAGALAVASDGFLIGRRARIVALATNLRVPTVYAIREFAEAGGLMSYGTNFEHGYRQVGVYAGRILKGEKPSELPVTQPTKFELVINLKTAKALGINVPQSILARADEVIE